MGAMNHTPGSAQWTQIESRKWPVSAAQSGGHVEIDLSAPDIARKKAFGMNTTCLTRWRGCDSTAQLLPTVWQKDGQNTIRSIIPNHEGAFDLLQMK